MSVTATLSWAWTGGLDQLGVPYGPPSFVDPIVAPSAPAIGTFAPPESPTRLAPEPAPPTGAPAWAGPAPLPAATGRHGDTLAAYPRGSGQRSCRTGSK